MGPLIPLFWTSGDVSLFTLGRCLYVTYSLRFTSGATLADLLAASMAAEPSLLHTSEACEALVGLETGSYHAAAHCVRSGRPDTELSYPDWSIPTRLRTFCLMFEILFKFFFDLTHFCTVWMDLNVYIEQRQRSKFPIAFDVYSLWMNL